MWWIWKELRRVNDRLDRLEAAIDAVLTYIEDLKEEFDTERFDAAIEQLEDMVPVTPEPPVEETV